ncbi:MAG: FG-GAP-like repeat-containing protein [Ignavibacteriota bacterium]
MTLGAQASSSLELAAAPNPSIFGAPVTLAASVTPVGATGKITFYADGALLGISAISDGHANLIATSLSSGVHTLLAHYGGDRTFSASTSPKMSQTVAANPAKGFQRAANFAGADTPTSIAIGDFNGDGKSDLVIGAQTQVSVCKGEGDGTFNCSTAYQNILGFVSAAVGDFNGDGKLDVALAVQTASLEILLGNGDGTLQPPSASYPIPYQPSAVAVSDFDGDGKADIIVVNSQDNSVSVFLGRG